MADDQTGIHPDARYTESHEWARPEKGSATPGIFVAGISGHAGAALGDVVFVELPKVGEHLAAGDVFGVVESVKSASDLYMPLAGTIIEVNKDLAATPGLLNTDCYDKGWIIRIHADNPADFENLLSPDEYAEIT